MSSALLRCSRRRHNSSIANITPPSGVLKAAAMPAAPPAISRPCSLIVWRSGSQRRALCSTPAAICTEGPSRPRDSPAKSPAVVSTTLPMASFIDTKCERLSRGVVSSSAAITCGMPEPPAPGSQRRVNQTMPAVTRGIHSRGAHQAKRSMCWN